MQFDSTTFLLFYPLVLVLYHLCASSLRVQNALIAVASLVFYAWFDWRLPFLLLTYVLVGYGAALWIHGERDERRKSRLLALFVALNLLGLGFSKY